MTTRKNKELCKFSKDFFHSESAISSIGDGSIGGKAEGLLFINNTLNTEIDKHKFPEFEIGIPKMIILCTDIFKSFLDNNDLYKIALSDAGDEEIAETFQEGKFTNAVLNQLKIIVENFDCPLTVRSSSLLEDNIYEPFSGIYSTKMIPNNDSETNLTELTNAIKFIFSSTYFKAAKDYMKATKHKIEEEKMAIIIQEVVGNEYNETFYPEISGIANSYNYYAFGKLKPEDCIVNLALGLGRTIVDGGITWAYSPSYPKISSPFASTSELLEQTQTDFWAVNLKKNKQLDTVNNSENEFLVRKNIVDAEKDGSLKYIVSSYDKSSDQVTVGLNGQGSRILTFAPVLNHEVIPLNKLIKNLLKVCENAMNAPVEIEFAVSFNKNTENGIKCRFGFLQLRPLAVTSKVVKIASNELNDKNVLAASETVLGNGKMSEIKDIVYVNPETFSLKLTREIVAEIELVNEKLISQNKPYLLIGFGRWGTSDPHVGLPAEWSQISGAKVIVEATLENTYIEMSQGSNLFQNLISFKVFYFSIPFAGDFMIDWDWLAEQKLEEECRFVNHVSLEKPLKIKVDGRSGKGVILKF